MKFYAVQKLNDRERYIIYSRFFDPDKKRMSEIAKELNISKECLRLIECSALHKINHSLLNRPMALRKDLKYYFMDIETVYNLIQEKNYDKDTMMDAIQNVIIKSWLIAWKIEELYKRKGEFVSKVFNDCDYNNIKDYNECFSSIKHSLELAADLMLLDLPGQIEESIVICNDIRKIFAALIRFFLEIKT